MKTFGIVGGLGTLSGGDLFFKLLKSKAVLENQQDFHFLFEQHPYQQMNARLENEADLHSRKFYAYTTCKAFEAKQVDKVLLPCFASHGFIDQLQTELQIPILNLFDALSYYLKNTLKKDEKVGIIASDYVKNQSCLVVILRTMSLFFPARNRSLWKRCMVRKALRRDI
ncbi:aspartate/glutamate racemase family protein [Siphonobacter sp. BAB-5385]|uniref:aspartate/glutamate racemase family protein n=1 Tax=Siphonobacter sp. BAB-5385 TaxID=1864822 RepID=UPI001C3CB543|nr:aspartate/glutamate racemase family protein [Siphonobacter sp. BAB-5385]